MKGIEILNIPASKVKQLKNKGIEYVEDLLNFLPKEYVDFSKTTPVTFDAVGKNISVIGKVLKTSLKNCRRLSITECLIETENGVNLCIQWFNQDYKYNIIKYLKGSIVYVCGKLEHSYYTRSFIMTNPIIFSRNRDDALKVIPVYKKIPGMSDDYLKGLIGDSLRYCSPKEYLDESSRNKFNLCKREDLYKKTHHPKTMDDVNASKRRLIFDDMFDFSKQILSQSTKNNSPFVLKDISMVEKITRNLPYSLTNDQSDTIKNMLDLCIKGHRLDALIQGDVGCGKSIVAFILMSVFADNGYQSVLMAPTQILADQHYKELKKLCDNIGFEVVELKSKMKVKERRDVLQKIESGKAKLIVGTHSVLSDEIIYNNLALSITDEEHKFGVIQKNKIEELSNKGLHTVTMSATPIPRSLALTLYGVNKEIYTITQMPNGRMPVKTQIIEENSDVYNFCAEKIKEGSSCYIVCPLIDKTDKETMSNVQSVEEVYKEVSAFFENSGIKVDYITGKTKSVELKDKVEKFKNGEINILVSTTIIEVGVNIPTANVMVIKSADRFGLSQMHQLRGRVGRSNEQGYCILQPSKTGDKASARFDIMLNSNDGFKIAEEDLKIRGFGDVLGIDQNGFNKNAVLVMLYPKFFKKVKDFTENYLKSR